MREVTEIFIPCWGKSYLSFYPAKSTPSAKTMREILAMPQDLPVKATILITTLAVGVMIGIPIGDVKEINCEISQSSYCKPLLDIAPRRGF